MNKREIGARYEERASVYLEQQGYRIIEKNYRCRIGEIDLIAEDREYLVFVEVKYRSGTVYGQGLEHVDRRKQQVIGKVAAYYFTAHRFSDRLCRFDIVSIDGAGDILHFENAFELTPRL